MGLRRGKMLRGTLTAKEKVFKLRRGKGVELNT